MHLHVFPFLQSRHIWRSKSFLKTLALSILRSFKFTVGYSTHQSRSRVMDCDLTAACSSKKKLSFRRRKKVSWAFNLEEVKYFSPDFEIQQFIEPEGTTAITGSMKTNLKKKPHALKNKRCTSFAEIVDRDFLCWLQEKGYQVMGKISGQYGVVRFRDLTLSEEK